MDRPGRPVLIPPFRFPPSNAPVIDVHPDVVLGMTPAVVGQDRTTCPSGTKTAAAVAAVVVTAEKPEVDEQVADTTPPAPMGQLRTSLVLSSVG